MGARPTNNPYGDAQLVDKLVGTAYDVVRIVSENMLQVKHVSLNMGLVNESLEVIDLIRPVSQQIDKVIAVGGNITALKDVALIDAEIVALYGSLSKLVAVANTLPNVNTVANNISDINAVVANLSDVADIVDALPALQAVVAQKQEILNAASEATASKNAAALSATAASGSKEAAAASATAANQSRTQASQSAGSADTSAKASEASRQAALQIQQTLLSGLKAKAVGVSNVTPASASYDPVTKEITFNIPQGTTGPNGVPNILQIGNVSSGPAAAASLEGNTPNQVLNLVLPRGAQGYAGWAPVLAVVPDGLRSVLQVRDWTGGEGVKPNTGGYVGLNGFTLNINEAINVRGPSGAGSGDMLSGQYDPAGRGLPVYDMANMIEAVNAKIMTANERTKLAGIEEGANKTPELAPVATSGSYEDLIDQPEIPQGTVTSVALEMPEGFEVTGSPITENGNFTISFAAGFGLITQAEVDKLAVIEEEATKNATDEFLLARENHTGVMPASAITGLEDELQTLQARSEKGQANGYASLDADGNVPIDQMPESVIGGMNYRGNWDASTNNPAIPPAAAANKGHYYIVNVAGNTNINDITNWEVGDWIVSNGTVWSQIKGTDQVQSVNGKKGAVNLTLAELGGQPALGFSPIQQGGGTGQSGNKIYIGWLGSTLGFQVDGSNFGSSWPISITGKAANSDAVGGRTLAQLIADFNYGDGLRVAKSGDQMTGDISLSGSGTSPVVRFKAEGVRYWYIQGTSDGSLRIVDESGNVQACSWSTAGGFFNRGNVYAAGAWLETNGNVWGSLWANWGHSDAFNAISSRIESRASAQGAAWANDRVANLQYRKVSRGSIVFQNGQATERNAPAGAVLSGLTFNGDGTARSPVYFHYLQVYDPVRGWVGFSDQ